MARHSAEGITKNLWVAILSLVLYQLISPDFVNPLSNLFLKLPFSRRYVTADYHLLAIEDYVLYDSSYCWFVLMVEYACLEWLHMSCYLCSDGFGSLY